MSRFRFRSSGSGTIAIEIRATAEFDLFDTDQGSQLVTVVTPAVSVTANTPNVTVPPLSSQTVGFTVSNPSTVPDTVDLTAACPSSLTFKSCGVLGPTTIPLGPMSSQPVSVSYLTNQPNQTGSVTLTASVQGQSPPITSSASTTVTTTAGTPAVAVTPDGGTSSANTNSASSVAFSVQNTGTSVLNLTFSASCTPSGFATCGTVSPSSLTMNPDIPFPSATVTVNFTTGSGNPSSGQVTLTATATGTSPLVQDNGSYTVTLNVQRIVDVIAPNPSSVTLAPNTPSSTIFTVNNPTVIPDTVNLSTTCTGVPSAIAACPTPSPSQDIIPSMGSKQVTLNFTSGNVNGASGTITLTATLTTNPSVTDNASFGVTVQQPVAGVTVTPDNAPITRTINTTVSDTFRVRNTGPAADTYTLSASCTGVTFAQCSLSRTSLTLGAGASDTVSVTHTPTATGAGTITLTASGAASDNGSYAVNVTSGGGGVAPVVSIADVQPGTSIARDQCLTFSLGRNLASECGDLRVTHPLPSVRTLGTTRTPTLLYSSAHAHPFTLVAFNVLIPGSTPPSRVDANITWPGRPAPTSAAWSGSGMQTNKWYRFVIGVDSEVDTTGAYTFTLNVQATVSGVAGPIVTMTGPLVIVNRKDSPYGAGWWLAGLENLVFLPGGDLLWVGGDGSSRRFVRQATPASTYVAQALEFPDTITFNTGTSIYTRKLPGGLRVQFNPQGLHTATINRLGHTTNFTYVAGSSPARLQSIGVPPASIGLTYSFAYDGVGHLSSVAAAGFRDVTVTTLANNQVQSIRDPDQRTVTFGYHPSAFRRIVSRADKRLTPWTVVYDAGWRVQQASVTPGLGGAPITTTLRALASYGLALPGGGLGTPIDTALASAQVDGPRPIGDVTQFWLDRFGAPRRIQNAQGFITSLTRGDARFASLVTQVQHFSAFIERATYDARGNLSTHTAVAPYRAQDAVTTYTWDQTWDELTQIRRPMGEVLNFNVDPANGNRLWQEDVRGLSSRVNFRFWPTGVAKDLLKAAQYPPVLGTRQDFDSLQYDIFGNVADVYQAGWGGSGPVNIVTATHTTGDQIGRPTRECAEINTSVGSQCTMTAYDVMSRDSVVVDSGPAMNTVAAQKVIIRHFYDAEGNRTRLERTGNTGGVTDPIGTITTQWLYDNAHRAVVEVAPDGVRDSTAYDEASNPVQHFTRRTDPQTGARIVLGMSYDILNRLATRTVPTVTYPVLTEVGINARHFQGDSTTYPRLLRNAQNGLTIVGDVESFTYDLMGRILTATNGDAIVTRAYFPNGKLETDRQQIREYATSNFNTHSHLVGYMYDLNGRRTHLTYPAALVAGTNGFSRYDYDPVTGLLLNIIDLHANTHVLAHNLQSQVDSIMYPGSIRHRFRYNAAGFLARDSILNRDTVSPLHFPTVVLRATSFDYDRRGRTINALNLVGKQDRQNSLFTGLGYLRRSSYQDVSGVVGGVVAFSSTDTLTWDALGNQLTSRTTSAASANSRLFERYTDGGVSFGLQPSVGRHVQTTRPRRIDNLLHDGAGNVVRQTSTNTASTYTLEDRMQYYDALNRLRVVDHRTATVTGQVGGEQLTFDFEDYRYDALGRRVLVRTRRHCIIIPDYGLCGLHTIRRTVWDGEQELIEIQRPGDDNIPAAELERDVGFSPWQMYVNWPTAPFDVNRYFGRVAYTPGLALDQPASLTRFDFQADSTQSASGGQPGVPSSFFRQWPTPFTAIPHWNVRGEADNGTFASGVYRYCPAESAPRCVEIGWPFSWTAYQQKTFQNIAWHGTLIEQKRDGSGLLYKRNRLVDPSSGRFTQEDPIGLEGGLNLYGFANGDPVNFADPFGLKVCFRGSSTQVGELRRGTEDATGTRIALDRENCVASYSRTGEPGFDEIQQRFGAMVNSSLDFGVEFGDPRQAFASHFNPDRTTAVILRGDYRGGFYRTGNRFTCAMFGGTGSAYWTLGSLIAHELIGHGGPIAKGGSGASQREAIRIENLYHVARGQPRRCN